MGAVDTKTKSVPDGWVEKGKSIFSKPKRRGGREEREGGMGGIRKSDQARQEGSGMLMFATPSIKETRVAETSMQE